MFLSFAIRFRSVGVYFVMIVKPLIGKFDVRNTPKYLSRKNNDNSFESLYKTWMKNTIIYISM